MTDPTVAPYGSWASPIRIDDVVGDLVGLAEPWLDGDETYWLEARPTEGGRRVLVRLALDGTVTDLTAAPFNVRTLVHEYGGGSYVVSGGVIVFSNFADNRLYRLDPGEERPVAITPVGPWRFADLRIDPRRLRALAIREDHAGPGEAPSSIVAIPLNGTAQPEVLVSGPDFVAAPRLSPDGARLAWLEWDHPDMPWDGCRLRTAAFTADGSLDEPVLAAGGLEESIVQPEWSPDGILHFVSDRTGWWNLYRLLPGPVLDPLGPMQAEFADPAWIFGRSSYAFLPDGSLAATGRFDGRDHLFHVRPDDLVGEVESPYSEFDWLRADAGGVVAVVGSPSEPTVLARFDPATLAVAGVLRRASSLVPDPAIVSIPEPIQFPMPNGRVAHALFYAPRNPGFVGPDAERPPLVVQTHGGPTSNASTALDLGKQLLTSRGIAIVDVDYGGSSGYGRAYRSALHGAWGVIDVDDCVAAARFLADRGDVDPERLAIEGASAGGFTTLAALAFRDVFAAGISRYGIGDLETMARGGHKFESRYMERLVGPYPEAADVYRQRSPLRFLDQIHSPALVMQGLDDHVVPPAQAEAIVAALESNGIPYAYLAFAGEGHGLRGAFAIRRSLEAELSFLGQVFGFGPADQIDLLDLPGLERWRARSPLGAPGRLEATRPAV